MRDYIIATDTSADLPEKYIKENNILIFPLHYIIDGVEYGREITELSCHDFYQTMRKGSMPTTSATNQEYVFQLMGKAAREGKDILYIGFSSGLSSSYSNGAVAAERIMEEHPECRCVAIDTLNATAGQAMMVDIAVGMKNDGRTLDETAEHIKNNLLHFPLLFTVDDLFHLAKGGRLSKGAAALGTIAGIKPMLHIEPEDGTLDVTGKVRGRKKAIAGLVETMASYGNIKRACVAHADCPDEAEALAEMARQRAGLEKVPVLELSPTLGAHSGAGTLVLGYTDI